MIRFSKWKYFSLTFSLLVIISCYWMTFSHFGGYARSLDFDGGIRIEVEFPTNMPKKDIDLFIDKMKPSVRFMVTRYTQGKHNIFKLEADKSVVEAIEGVDPLTQQKQASFWNYLLSFFYQGDLELKQSPSSKEHKKKGDVLDTIRKEMEALWQKEFSHYGKLKFLSLSKIGPAIGLSLRKNAVNLLLTTMFFIILYLTVRFEFRFGVAALIALLHDLIIVWGLVGVLQIPPTIPIIAALLTILGYSINDTIVIFDRIRENKKALRNATLDYLIDLSIWQSMSRTLLTSLTTLISVIALFFLGGEELKDFSFILILGIIIGTYSSIFIASPVLLIWERFRKRRVA